MCHLDVIVVNPASWVVLLSCVAHIVTSVNARTQVRDEALQSVVAALLCCLAAPKDSLRSLVDGRSLVDLHLVG